MQKKFMAPALHDGLLGTHNAT